MQKIFLFMMTSLDGYFEGVNHDLSWHNVDEEFGKFAIAQLKEIDTILFGRRTYEMMADFWPSQHARQVDPQTANIMNTLPKVVFSKTLKRIKEGEHWKNVILLPDVDITTLRKLKLKSRKSLAVFGSSDLCLSLFDIGMLDELRIMVNPVMLGEGKQLFSGINDKLKLSLNNTRTFKNGNVLLCYEVIKKVI